MDELKIFLAGFTVALIFYSYATGFLYTLGAGMIAFRGPGTLGSKWRAFKRALRDFPHGF